METLRTRYIGYAAEQALRYGAMLRESPGKMAISYINGSARSPEKTALQRETRIYSFPTYKLY